MLVGVSALAAAAFIAGTILLFQPAPAANQRTAFFGFTADASDPATGSIAKAATDEAFQVMNALRLETASRATTEDVELSAQIGAAKDLGARYALGGSVRSTSGEISVSMRLDDVQRQATIWEETIRGGSADSVSLPV